MYWAQELTAQNEDMELKNEFESIAEELTTNETLILDELNKIKDSTVNIDGSY